MDIIVAKLKGPIYLENILRAHGNAFKGLNLAYKV